MYIKKEGIKMLKRIVVAIALTGTLTSANALEGRYAGIGYSFDNTKINNTDFNIEDGQASSINLNYGYNLNRYMGIELKTKIGLTGTESGVYKPTCDPDELEEDEVCGVDQVERSNMKSHVSLNVKLGMPISEYVTLIGKYGYGYTNTEIERVSYSSEDGSKVKGSKINTKVNGYSNTYGAGFSFEMKNKTNFGIMYNMFYKDDNVKHYSLEFDYNVPF